jgi:hypothetical protein
MRVLKREKITFINFSSEIASYVFESLVWHLTLPPFFAPHYYDFLTQHDSCTTTNCPAYGRSWWDAALDKCQDAQFLETLGACTNTDARFTPQYSGYKMGTEHRN